MIINHIKPNKQKGFFDEDNRRAELLRHKDPLKRIDSVVPWEMFRSILNSTFEKKAKGPGGRPSFDYVMMFKILILQRYYNISDEQVEFQIKDRLSFQTFLGLTLSDKVPDEKTIWLFRNTLSQCDAIEKLFKSFERYLRDSGLILSEGSMIDASFVEVPRQRNSRDENKDIKNGKTPKDWENNKKKLSQKDVDARWTKKNGVSYYGYKDHIKADTKSKLITKYNVTDASVHDSQPTGDLLDNSDSDKPLHADSAYSGADIENQLNDLEIINKIQEKGYRNHPLTEEQKKKNRIKSLNPISCRTYIWIY